MITGLKITIMHNNLEEVKKQEKVFVDQGFYSYGPQKLFDRFYSCLVVKQ